MRNPLTMDDLRSDVLDKLRYGSCDSPGEAVMDVTHGLSEGSLLDLLNEDPSLLTENIDRKDLLEVVSAEDVLWQVVYGRLVDWSYDQPEATK